VHEGAVLLVGPQPVEEVVLVYLVRIRVRVRVKVSRVRVS